MRVMRDARAIIVVDLGFGDAGKGTIVDFLTREYDAHTVVRSTAARRRDTKRGHA
jgi:adenylosuccinate synthase